MAFIYLHHREKGSTEGETNSGKYVSISRKSQVGKRERERAEKSKCGISSSPLM